ncbi:MAG: hypothetical protein ABW095_12805, partial [Candidatus Thiodiazotropha sp.]
MSGAAYSQRRRLNGQLLRTVRCGAILRTTGRDWVAGRAELAFALGMTFDTSLIFTELKVSVLIGAMRVPLGGGVWVYKRVFDLMKDFGTSKSTKIDSIFDSLLVPR